MRIIKRGVVPPVTATVVCDYCGTVFEVEREECNVTGKVSVLYDGLGCYNIDCPICSKTQYFDFA